ncbi:AAA family ATPase [Bacillus dakarensis]|uniref:AAA family ATPase n=1 Tax=Robertmurraya dakarensis TaxID=1926278 RepID=UPI0009823CAD|nr:MoxR family ATPase [Bacillus dakarensis]
MTELETASDLRVLMEEILEGLKDQRYLADERTAMTVALALSLEKPILIEGPAGVGKTELAKAISGWKDCSLIRLQCYEGIDEAKALYEWDYRKQLLSLQMGKENSGDVHNLFSEAFLLERPLLAAIRNKQRPVLLIDEIDKSDPEFESMLLELLSDFQITIPELGTMQAVQKPIVILTSNKMRQLSEALRRRCLYLYLDYPTPEQEAAILRKRVPALPDEMVDEIAMALAHLRLIDLRKAPSISEAVDWAEALVALNITKLDHDIVLKTLNVLIKDHSDLDHAKNEIEKLLGQINR